MTPLALRLLALSIGPALAAAARPALTVLALLSTLAWLASRGVVVVPAHLAWSVSLPALSLTAFAAFLEALAAHDAHLAQLLRALGLDHLGGALASAATPVALALLGAPPRGEGAALDGVASDLVEALRLASAADGARTALVVLACVIMNAWMVAARRRLLDALDDLHVGAVVAWIETGGVLAALALVPFAPALALGLVVAGSLALAALGLVVRALDRALDARARRACAACGASIRVEASRCPSCRHAQAPARLRAGGLS